MLDLLSHRQGLNPSELFPFLRNELRLPIPAAMEQAYKDYRRTIQAFALTFREAQKGLLAPTQKQRELLRKLGLLASTQLSSERWFEGMCQFCGITDLSVLRSRKLPVPVRGDASCVVVPFCVVPGFAHRLHLIMEDMTWDLTAAELVDPTSRDNAPAYAGMQLLHKSDARWFVGTTMVDMLLRAQVRRLSTDPDPLPMFGWTAREEAVHLPDITLLQSRPVVLWERTLSPHVLQLAEMLGAKIAIGRPDTPLEPGRSFSRTMLRSFVDKTSPYDLCDKLRQHALAPRSVLWRWWGQATEPDKLRMYDACKRFSDTTANMVRNLPGRPHKVPRPWQPVRVGKGSYTVRKHQLYDAEGRMVSAYTFDIRRIVWVRGNLFCLVGKVRSLRKVYHLRFYARYTNAWQPLRTGNLTASLLAAGLETGAFAAMPANKLFKLLTYVSLRTRKPLTERGTNVAGWRKNIFWLPDCRVGKGVRPRRYNLLPGAPGLRQVPSQPSFGRDTSGYRAEIRELYWSLLFALCVQATAQRAGPLPGGIVLRDPPSTLVRTLQKTLALQIPSKTGFWPHDWPYFYADRAASSGNTALFVAEKEDDFVASSAFCRVFFQDIPWISTDFHASLVSSLTSWLAWLSVRPRVASWHECIAVTKQQFEVFCPGSTQHLGAVELSDQ